MKRVCAAFVVVVLGAVAAVIGAAAAGASSSSRSITIHLVEKSIGFNFIDNPPRQGRNAAPLMGDQFAFSSELLTKSGKHAGYLDATCTVTRGGERGAGTCYGTFSLKGGEIAGISAISFASGSVDHVAIVGGTGAYERVTGSVASKSRGGDNSPYSDDTMHLIYP
jgi:hypothetical protein